VVAAAVVGAVVGGVVVVGGAVVGSVVGSVEVGVGAEVDVDVDDDEDVEVDGAVEVVDDAGPVAPGAAVVDPGWGCAAAPPGVPAEVPATWAMTSATVDLGPRAGTVPASGGWTAAPGPPDGASPLIAGPVPLRAASIVESGVEP
jgi:hypothetical protein